MRKRFVQIRDSIKIWYESLSQKERIFVLIFFSSLFAVVFALMIVFISSSIRARYMDIEDKEKKLRDIIAQKDKYREAEQAQRTFEQRLKNNNVNLFSFVEEISRRLQVDISDMNERESPVQKGDKIREQTLELNISKIPMDRLVDFMKEIEKGQYLVKIKKLKINTRYEKENRTLNVNMIVATYKPVTKE
ncbi:MAG: type II secretion system protein M [Deltaproteobacteria bacterium]|nr:type II secretion system protein M [Deltaproteobacteria bacterium]